MFIRADNAGILTKMCCYYAFKDINIQFMFLIHISIKTAKILENYNNIVAMERGDIGLLLH